MIGTPGDGFPMAACTKVSCPFPGRLPYTRRARIGKYCSMLLDFYAGLVLVGASATLSSHWFHTMLLKYPRKYKDRSYVDINLWFFFVVWSYKLAPLADKQKFSRPGSNV